MPRRRRHGLLGRGRPPGVGPCFPLGPFGHHPALLGPPRLQQLGRLGPGHRRPPRPIPAHTAQLGGHRRRLVIERTTRLLLVALGYHIPEERPRLGLGPRRGLLLTPHFFGAFGFGDVTGRGFPKPDIGLPLPFFTILGTPLPVDRS
jgi:hypothetical protein